MIKLLLEAGAKFNTTDKTDNRSLIPFSFINQFINSFIYSTILTKNDGISLTQMLNNQPETKLVYRATRDGFAASSFHSKCDNISNTVTIIKTTSNSVFGGFTSATWRSDRYYGYYYDANAFIFSLRRSGNLNKERFNVTSPNYAINSLYSNGPTFGGGYDLYVSDNSNTNENSRTGFGNSYQLPKNMTLGEESISYLAGSFYWRTTEIEVYQVTLFRPYSVSFLHNGCLFYWISKKLLINYNFF
jgi:hypothetical protein